MLKEGLSEELSTEERIVTASLNCVEKSQRPGVGALFQVFGCFEEDAQVPAQALDLLAPVVCRMADVDPASHLKLRKWLASLIRGSLLHENPNGIHVHGELKATTFLIKHESHHLLVGHAAPLHFLTAT